MKVSNSIKYHTKVSSSVVKAPRDVQLMLEFFLLRPYGYRIKELFSLLGQMLELLREYLGAYYHN